MAEAIFKHHTKGISWIGRIDSAGAGDPNYLLPTDRRTLRTLLRHGIEVTERHPRPVIPEDYTHFRYILAVDKPTLNRLKQFQKNWSTLRPSHIGLLGEFSESRNEDVTDPYGQNENAFEDLFFQLTKLCVNFLGSITRKVEHP
jgi:protein-tyrosine phosphatase